MALLSVLGSLETIVSNGIDWHYCLRTYLKCYVALGSHVGPKPYLDCLGPNFEKLCTWRRAALCQRGPSALQVKV